jgi:ABC-type branched-subunit amino acid transport system substrate-binding protein
MRTLILGMLLVAMQASAADIYVGQSAPLSGNNADIGLDIRNGAKAYFKKVNDAGGVNGNKVIFVSIDDQNDYKFTAEVTKKLIFDYGAVALFGYTSATAAMAGMPTVIANRVPLFAPFTGTESLRSASEYVYTLRPTYAEEMEKIVTSWGSLNYSNIVVLYYDDAVGKENLATVSSVLAKTGKKANGIALKRGADFTDANLKAIIAADPQVIIVTTYYQPAITMMKKIKAANKQFNVASLSLAGASQYPRLLGADAAGITVVLNSPTPKAAVPVVKECNDAWIASGQKDPMSVTALESCIAAKVLVEGMKKAGPSITRETLHKALGALTKVDVGGYGYEFKPGSIHSGNKMTEVAVIRANGDMRN